MLSVVIEAFKNQNVPLFTFRKLLFGSIAAGLYITLHSSPARLHGIHPVRIHLMGIRDSPDHRSVVIKRLRLYEFTLCGRDLVSVVHIRETPYYRGFF